MLMYTDKFWKILRLDFPTCGFDFVKVFSGDLSNCIDERCYDDQTTCITIMICVLGDMSYVTWGTIFVNTSGRGGPSGGDGGPKLRLGSIF